MSETTSTGATDTQAVDAETDRTPPAAASASADGQEQSSGSQANTTQPNNNQNQQADPQVRELRREAANYRTQLSEAKTQLEASTAARSAIEAERDALKAELRDYKVGGAIRDVVSMAQPVHAEPVLALLGTDFKIDGRTGEVDRDAISAKLTDIQTRFPTLFRGANLGGDAGAGGGSANGIDMNRALRQAAGIR